jgi:hypothetical protein
MRGSDSMKKNQIIGMSCRTSLELAPVQIAWILIDLSSRNARNVSKINATRVRGLLAALAAHICCLGIVALGLVPWDCCALEYALNIVWNER